MEDTLATAIIDAFEGARWGVAAGAILLALVWIFRKLTAGRLPPKLAPIISAAVAVVLAMAGGLYGGAVWYDAVLTGLLVGGAASGFWSLLGKYILPLPKS